jgi:nucleosome binding factor SPN SPT16 subunit
MTGGCQCGAYALTGKPFCYFHSRLHRDARKPVSLIDSIDIPLLEDRCAVQLVITRVLRALVDKTVDRQTASTLLYGLQLAMQGVAHDHYDVRFDCVKALSQTPDGDEIAANPGDELKVEQDEQDDEGGDELEKDEDDENDENEEDTDPSDEDQAESGDEEDSSDDDGEDGEEEDNPSIEQLIAGQKYLESISLALEANDMRQVSQLISQGG